MSFTPCLEVPNKKKKTFDSKLCLVCQKKVEDAKRGKRQEKKAEHFEVFINVCKALKCSGDMRYIELQLAIKDKTAKSLHDAQFCFHTKCRKQFQVMLKNHSRTKARESAKDETKLKASSNVTPKVTRKDTTSFNKDRCLFCQIDIYGEQLINVCQDSRDQILKDAFTECPNSLELYRIRTSHAFDAMAGDIKYHPSCWRDIIDKRVPEIQRSQPSSSAASFDQQHNETVQNADENTDVLVENQDEDNDDQRPDTLETPIGKEIELRNGRNIKIPTDTNTERPDDSLKALILSEIMEGLKIELSCGRAIPLNNLVEIYRLRIKEQNQVDQRTDKAVRIEFQRLVTLLDGVEIEKDYQRNRCQKIYTSDSKAFALKYAEENSSLSNDEEISILKKASMILRKRTSAFIQKNPLKAKDIAVTCGAGGQQEFPPELSSFMNGVLFGQRKLLSQKSEERETLTNTISSFLMYNIKTDRQVKYAKKRKTRSRHRYTPQQLASLALAIRYCERNNSILRLLSAPNYGITIPPRMVLLLETMIANAMIKIAEKDGVYIPPNMERGARISFHIDNFDEQIQTFDGKNTVHYLLIVCFQRKIQDFKPIELKLEKTTSLSLKDNSLGDVMPCDDPTTRQFKRSVACEDFSCSASFVECRSKTLFVWQCFRSFEHLLVIDKDVPYLSDEMSVSHSPIVDDDRSLDEQQSWNLNSLVLPSFSATNSLVASMDTTLTNIYSLPFIRGPASSTSAIFTALEIAHKTSVLSSIIPSPIADEHENEADEFEINIEDRPTLTRPLDPPPPWKTIIVLDLDLYAKAYKLVHSRSDLRNRYVLCLGELHAVFASLRAIGTFIDCSGLDDAWMNAGWFDSESLLRQIKDCTNMKRAMAAHEATLIAVHIMILHEALQWHGRWNEDEKRKIYEIVKMARDSVKDSNQFHESWKEMNSLMTTLGIGEKIKTFITAGKANRFLQFLVKYSDMVMRLFTFVEATRIRSWILHLDSFEDLIADWASMDRNKYRLWSAIYIADMRYLEHNDPDTWKYFMEGNFCCQKNDISFTAIGRDHCGEQENKVLKGRGGVSGQSSNSNSTNRYFMIAPVLSQIYSEMLRAGGESSFTPRHHHQLSDAYIKRQNKWVISLLNTFHKQNVSLSVPQEETTFTNIITGQVFSDTIYENLIAAYDIGKKLYEVFVAERLKPDSKVGIFAPLKKAMLKLCKSASKSVVVKYKDKVATLKEENIFIARIAMIRGSRDVDMKYHIGFHELSPVIHSLMKRDGTLLDGWQGKSDLAKCILNEANVQVHTNIPHKSECVAIDAMFLVNQISTKPLWVKTGSDLAAEFCKRVDQQSQGSEVVVIGFEWYALDSLKSKAWESREKNSKCKAKKIDYIIEPSTDLTKRSMRDIVGTIPTKVTLTKLLMDAVVDHMKARNVEYFIAGNGLIFSSIRAYEGATNHKEGETAIILGLSSMNLKQRKVVVYGNDVDLFVLLLAHYNNIDCMDLQMKSLNGYTSLTAVHNFYGHPIASALLPFHALTGCDVTGKFSSRTKEYWTKKFLEERNNKHFIDALLSLHRCQFDQVINELASFICRSYCNKTTPKRITSSLAETRYFLYKKFSSETNKLPPTHGAFLQHLKRTSCPLVVWKSANLPMTLTIDHLSHGWELNENGALMPVCTHERIAPEGLVELVSCNCNGECANRLCTCKKGNTNCTDLCGCGDICLNTDAPPPSSTNDDEDEEEIDEVDECNDEELDELDRYLQELDELDECEQSEE